MKLLLWIVPAFVSLIPICALYLGGNGRTRTHRLAALSGALAVLGLVLIFPVGISTALSGLASTHNKPYQDLPVATYFAALCLALVTSFVTSVILLKKRRVA